MTKLQQFLSYLGYLYGTSTDNRPFAALPHKHAIIKLATSHSPQFQPSYSFMYFWQHTKFVHWTDFWTETDKAHW